MICEPWNSVPTFRFSIPAKLGIEASVKSVSEVSMKTAVIKAVAEIMVLLMWLSLFYWCDWQYSLHGDVSTTLFDTRKVVNVLVLSKFCLGCYMNLEAHDCMNYDGASGDMKAVGQWLCSLGV